MWTLASVSVAHLLQALICCVFRDAFLYTLYIINGYLGFWCLPVTSKQLGHFSLTSGNTKTFLPRELPLTRYFILEIVVWEILSSWNTQKYQPVWQQPFKVIHHLVGCLDQLYMPKGIELLDDICINKQVYLTMWPVIYKTIIFGWVLGSLKNVQTH